MRARAALAAVLFVLVGIGSTGCAPSHALRVSDREVPTDILLKGTPAAVTAPLPVQPGFPLAPETSIVPAISIECPSSTIAPPPARPIPASAIGAIPPPPPPPPPNATGRIVVVPNDIPPLPVFMPPPALPADP